MSHTATGEWKSFEVRMRRRRAERLLLRADVAAEAGCLDEARVSLDEARALWPAAPGLSTIEQKIARGRVTEPEQPAHSRWKELTAAGAALLFIGAAAMMVAATRDKPLPAHTVTALAGSVPVGASLVAPPAVARTPVFDPAPANEPATRESTPTAPPPPRTPQPSDAIPVEFARSDLAPVGPIAVPAAPPVPVPAVASLTWPSIVVTASDGPPVQPPPEALIRGALARYAAAYNELDADAAERVWPSVNRAALARAFDSLASQHVSLGDCRIELDGNAAHASCDGSATWMPKAGGREHTDERSWTFDLEKSSAGWLIVSARVQNR